MVVGGFEVGQTAVYECDAGFRVDGLSERTCTQEGSWSGHVANCREIVCDHPDAPANGIATYTSVTYGSKVLFQCDEGYVSNGTQQQTCGSDGVWIGGHKDPQCLPRHCVVPEMIPHGYIGFEGNIDTGSAILYECEEGYEVKGTRERFCLASGEWTGQEPTCQVIHCQPLPSQMEHGRILGKDTVYNSVVQFSCDPGYELVGPDRITCTQNKHWNDLFPVCKPIQCPHPGMVTHGQFSLTKMNGRLNTDVFHYGDVVTFSCHAGFGLVGAAERSCLQDGSWSSRSPVCSKMTCPLNIIPKNGYRMRYYNVSPKPAQPDSYDPTGEENERADVGQLIRFGCKPGFQLTGSFVSVCLETGHWNTTEQPRCVPVQCPPPPVIKHGTHDSNETNFIYSDLIQYRCASGFRLKGNDVLFCAPSGTWEGQIPVCQRAVCPVRDVMEHGKITPVYPPEGSKGTHAVLLKFACHPGFDMIGNAEAECTNSGTWSHPVPSCVPWPCSSPPVPEHGSIEATDVTVDTITALVRCDPGFRLSENSNLTCGPTGLWVGSAECYPELCPEPQLDPLVKYQVQDSYQFGDRLNFSCADGYVLADPTCTITCLEHGQWRGVFPSCSPVTCPALQDPQFGKAEPSGRVAAVASVVKFQCIDGFSLIGQPQVTCQSDGRWSTDVPVCQALSCPDPAKVDNGLMTVHGNLVGDIIHYSCDSGFHLMG